MVIEITNYYALPGQSDAVFEQRQHASQVRADLGLPVGRIFRKLEGTGPDVRWECYFESRAEYEADLARRNDSAEFRLARETMHTLLERFERHLQTEADST